MASVNETALVKAAIEWLLWKRVFCWRNNTGAMALGGDDGTKKRFVRYGIKGASDILGVLPGGRFLAAEAKVGRNKLTGHQKDFLHAVNDSGGLGIVFYSLDELEQQIYEALEESR